MNGKTRCSPAFIPGGAVILYLARWHHEDISRRILVEEGDKWEVLNLPAESEGEGVILDRPAS
ncbi:hypothetical protein [Peribacillus frigoritolerans]|uniref:hypothetical protein n=1 Tax=Peribacillus castrilensis TaxID=2897690 RepID=UPI00296F89DE|nr:hypothetical protein [Peribacillus castrilensis]